MATQKVESMSRPEFMRALRRVFGKPCWGVQFGFLNLSMNFGKPSLQVDEPKTVAPTRSQRVREIFAQRRVTVRGQWWLWLQSCTWKLTSFNRTAYLSSSKKRMEYAMASLDGQELVDVEISERTGATRFHFDLGDILDCRRVDAKEVTEMWNLYQPDGRVLIAHTDGSFTQTP